jgi:hypothetical protein
MAREGVEVVRGHIRDAPPGAIGRADRTDAGWRVTVCAELSERDAVEALLRWWAQRSWTGFVAEVAYERRRLRRG